MVEDTPLHNLSAKELRNAISLSYNKPARSQETHPSDILGVVPWGYSENLESGPFTFVLALPDIPKFTVINCALRCAEMRH